MNYQQFAIRISEQLGSILSGKEAKIRLLLITLLSGGHLLLEDVPGVGKTTLAKSAADALSFSFGRIQFTPDTLPGDVTGISVYRMETGEFVYMPGAIMHQIVLADEINRTAPKTQASLLEAMAEGQVTVDGICHPLPKPFFVIATQNPIDFLGTYYLPEAQLDRFFMRVSLGYPEHAAEQEMARRFLSGTLNAVQTPAAGPDDVIAMQEEVKSVAICSDLVNYIIQITEATRENENLLLGASPRATLNLIRASQAAAYLSGRDYVIPDDVKELALPVLTHRLTLSVEAKMKKADAGGILTRIMKSIRVPVL